MKPLVRWTIGPVMPDGFKALRVAVVTMRRLYGDSLDYIVCHNQLSEDQKEMLKSLDCELYEQKGDELFIPPTISTGPQHEDGTRACWKLYPPRLRIDAYEFIIDNDLVVCEKIEEFDLAIKGKLARPVLCEGMRRSYGYFENVVCGKVPMNNGLIGLPPGFDFKERIAHLLPEDWKWTSYFDDQGLTAAVLGWLRPRIIPRSVIELIEPGFEVPPRKGYHFVMMNSVDEHWAWKRFSQKLIGL